MLVSSAASPIGRNPAMRADATPSTQVMRFGTRCFSLVLENHGGSRPSRLIA